MGNYKKKYFFSKIIPCSIGFSFKKLTIKENSSTSNFVLKYYYDLHFSYEIENYDYYDFMDVVVNLFWFLKSYQFNILRDYKILSILYQRNQYKIVILFDNNYFYVFNFIFIFRLYRSKK